MLYGLSSCDTASDARHPALATPTLDGGNFDLAVLKGKVVIIHFWATWCASCRTEMPALDDFYLHHHARGIEIIALSMDRSGDRDDVIAYMRKFHFPASLISDAKTNSFGSPGILPVTYVISKQGTVQSIITPDKTPLTRQSLEHILLPLLQQ